MFDSVLRIYVVDLDGKAVSGAKVSWTVLHAGVEKTLGPVTTQGLQDKPVDIQFSNPLDEPVVRVAVSYKRNRAEARVPLAKRDFTFVLNTRVPQDQPTPAPSAAGLTLPGLLSLLQQAIKQVTAVRFAYGIVGVAAAGAIVNLVLGASHVAYLTVGGMLALMFLLFIFAKFEKSKRLSVRLAGDVIIIVIAVAFVTFIATSAATVLTCRPITMVFWYGLSEACSDVTKNSVSDPAFQTRRANLAAYVKTLTFDQQKALATALQLPSNSELPTTILLAIAAAQKPDQFDPIAQKVKGLFGIEF